MIRSSAVPCSLLCIAAANLLGLPADQLVNKKLDEFVHPDDQDKYFIFIREYNGQHSKNNLVLRLTRQPKVSENLQCPGFRLTDCEQESCSQYHRFIYVDCQRAVNFLSANDNHICLAINDISDRKMAVESISCLNEKLEQKINQQTLQLVEANESLSKKITELLVSEHQLIEREAKLNAIFNAALEGIVTFDHAGIIVSANAASETIFGYPLVELIGCHVNKLIPNDNKKHDQFFHHRNTQTTDQTLHVDGRRKDGTIVPLDMSIAEFAIDGVPYNAGIVRDISLRRQKEQEDKMHLDELAHVTRIGLMGEMASGIAHEVNQPLTAIASYTQACLNFLQSDNPDRIQLREILQKTNQQALKAGQIIHRMREFVTFKTAHRSSIDINDLVNTCLSFCATHLKLNNIQLKCLLEKNLPMVNIDSVQIEQVLLNLIRNSLDALANLPDSAHRLLQIQTYVDKPCIVIRIKDNGPGIAESDQGKIFQSFYTTKKSGMGMGLSICKSIIKAHEGTLSFNSTPGKGTSFYIHLPLHKH